MPEAAEGGAVLLLPGRGGRIGRGSRIGGGGLGGGRRGLGAPSAAGAEEEQQCRKDQGEQPFHSVTSGEWIPAHWAGAMESERKKRV